MTILSAQQQAAVYAYRRKLWVRHFEIHTWPAEVDADAYDSVHPAVQPTITAHSGDWVWQQQDRRRGAEGGTWSSADIILNCDILLSGAIFNPKARLRVEDVMVAPTGLTTYEDTQEIVISGRRVA